MDTTSTRTRTAAAALLSRSLLVRQDDMLSALDLGDNLVRQAVVARLADEPTVTMVWDENGQPYYANADRLAYALQVLPYRLDGQDVVLPLTIAQGNARRP